MGAPKGNNFWNKRERSGREGLFESADHLWEAACEYFQWCEDNPLQEEKLFHYQGVVTKETVSKMRAYTLSGLCLYLDCSDSYFRAYKSRNKENPTDLHEDIITVIKKIERVIYEQKFTGAAADLLNHNIIARDLGLTDKKDIKAETHNKHIITGMKVD